MNRLRSSTSCRICGAWLEARWSRVETPAERRSIERQMDNGMCDECQIRRQAAAVAYVRAMEDLRLLQLVDARRSENPDQRRAPMQDAISRAEARCIGLRMWARTTVEPDRDRFVDRPRPRHGSTPLPAHLNRTGHRKETA